MMLKEWRLQKEIHPDKVLLIGYCGMPVQEFLV